MGQYLGNRISNWNVYSVTSLHRTFAKSHIDSDISKWSTGRARDLSYFLQGALRFDSDLTEWDSSSFTSLRGTFEFALTQVSSQ